ncbi:MAG: magnesium-translocating P-type ATPase [Thermoplasmata archaeon]|nr:magnesium-translocating P-type ATPase [Thermoplasmata archaeon]
MGPCPHVVKGSTDSPEQRLRRAASMEADDVLNEYDSRLEGHFNEELTTSRIKYGMNAVTNHNKHQVLKRLYRSFVNIFIITLAIIDVLWMVLDPDWIYFIILTTLIVVSGTVTFIQETRSSRAAAQLVSMVTTIITVVREGSEMEVDSREIVVGDIVILDTGDMIPADVRIVQSNHLKVDQSALTGESNAVTKYSAPETVEGNILSAGNMAFMGTNVVGGSAVAVVVAVGDDTVFGGMAESLSRKKPTTTYDKGSKAIVNTLLRIMFLMVPPVFVIMVYKGYVEGTEDYLIEAVKYALTLAIGLMPEMLATIVSTNLAKGAIDMSKKKVIVKDVTSIQNFGAMDVLCSDKTGTLTQNRISVKDCSDLYGNSSHSVELFSALNARNLKSATNQIDWALDEYAEEFLDSEEIESYQPVGDVPFDFERRRATVVVRRDEEVDLMITKGAIPEMLSISSAYLDQDRNIQPMDEKKYNEIMGMIEWYSVKGMRVLGVGYKYIPTGKTEFTSEDEYDLIMCGYVVFTDPVKPSAAQAIKDMADYGIAVKVLTGDNQYVTRHVCEQIGIDVGEILTGDVIDGMSDQELNEAVERIQVFTSLTPDNKSRVVLALKANGHTVGLMGDGINDVLAMRNADVSISVDTGTDIAKETASMILLEKDLNVLKTGAIEGRKVYVNSIKYVKMIGSINFGYMFSLVLGSLLFNFEPMGGIMILIFNLINDFACLFTPWDKVEDEFVREPRHWDAINLRSVMVRYGPMCVVTDVMSWIFFIFVVFPLIDVSYLGVEGVNTAADAILGGYRLGEGAYEALLPVAVLFQSMWCIEQYWMQVWSIHIVRTNKLPFFQTCSAKILVVTTIVALAVGTILPFTGGLWEAISECDALIAIPLWALLWMPFIGAVYFFGSHLVKRRMLRTHGYFAC